MGTQGHIVLHLLYFNPKEIFEMAVSVKFKEMIHFQDMLRP